MTAGEYLSRILTVDKLVDSKTEQIANLRDMAEHITVSYGSEAVQHSRKADAMENAVIAYVDLEAELNKEITEMLRFKSDAIKVIGMVKNGNQRLVLEKYYLCGWALKDIAEELNYTVRWVKQLKADALAYLDALDSVTELIGRVLYDRR